MAYREKERGFVCTRVSFRGLRARRLLLSSVQGCNAAFYHVGGGRSTRPSALKHIADPDESWIFYGTPAYARAKAHAQQARGRAGSGGVSGGGEGAAQTGRGGGGGGVGAGGVAGSNVGGGGNAAGWEAQRAANEKYQAEVRAAAPTTPRVLSPRLV